MVLLDQVVQVFRRAQLRIRGQPAIGLQFTHRTVRCHVAVQRDCPRAALLAFDRFTKVRLGSRHVISSDVHALSINGPAFDQLVTMLKFLCLGMELVDVIRASTAAPAAVLGRTDIGRLAIGAVGDASVLELEEGNSNTAMSWARFAPDGNGSKRVDLW
jgi:hypothetical protein